MQAPAFLAAGSVLSTFHHERYAAEALGNVSWDATSANGVALRCIVTARAHLGWTWYVTVESLDGRNVIAGGETDTVADAIRSCAVAAATASVTLYEVQTADGAASYGRHATMALARGDAASRTRLTGDRHRVVTIA